MKLWNFILFIFCFGVSASYPPCAAPNSKCLGEAIQLEISPFIQQIDHPYIRKREYIRPFPLDYKKALCDLENTSFRRPDDLFQTLRGVQYLCNPWPGRNPEQRVRMVLDILDCPAALNGVEELSLTICMGFWDVPSTKDLDLLVQLLNQTPHLKTLSMNWEQGGLGGPSREVREYFATHPINLPNVENLALGPFLDFLIPAAPKLQSLKSLPTRSWTYPFEESCEQPDVRDLEPPRIPFIRMAGMVEGLKEFEFKAFWDADMLKALSKLPSGIERLTLKGYLGWPGEVEPPKKGDRLKMTILTMAKFQNLTELHFDGEHALDLGWPDEEECFGSLEFKRGSICQRGPEGAKIRREAAVKSLRLIDEAGQLAAQTLPNLGKLCFGVTCGEMTSHQQFVWPWTGKSLGNYLLGLWPRYVRDEIRCPDHEDPEGPILGSWEEDEKWIAGGVGPLREDLTEGIIGINELLRNVHG